MARTNTNTGSGGGTIAGTIAAGQVGYGTALDTLGSDAFFTRSLVDGTTRIATFGSNQIFQIDSTQFHFGNGTNFVDLVLQRIVGQIDSLYLGQDAGNLGNESGTGRNTGMGYGVMRSITTGSDNAVFGQAAGFALTTGTMNTFIGSSAGRFNTIGDLNTFIGEESGYTNVSGGGNVFMGYRSGRLNSTGGTNVYIGYISGENGVTAADNVFIGSNSGTSNLASRNIFIGTHAGALSQSGTDNVFLGDTTGNTSVTGDSLVLIGSGADVSADGWDSSIGIGRAVSITASNQLLFGSATHPIYDARIGDYTSATNGTFIHVQDSSKKIFLFGTAVYTTQYDTPLTGATVVSNGANYLILEPAGALADLTITLPASPSDGQPFSYVTTQAITTVTLDGGTVVGGSFSGVGGQNLVYEGTQAKWYVMP